jgi:hypothetical protein
MTDALNQHIPTPKPRRQRRFLPGCLVALLLLAALGVGGALRIRQLYLRPPAHWLAYQQWKRSTSLDERRALATALEQRVAAMANVRTRDGTPIGDGQGLGPRTLTMSFAEVNAWLDTALPDFERDQGSWCQTRGLVLPPEVTEPMLAADEDSLVVCFLYRSPQFSAVVSAYCDIAVPREGAVTLKVRKVKLNDLRLPRGVLTRVLEAQARSAVVGQAQVLLDGTTFPAVEPVWGGTRLARLTAVEVRPDGLTLTANLVPRNSRN